jgi:hypothetical protein
MLYIVAASAAAYLLGMMDTTGSFYGYLRFSPPDILRGELWRLVTWLLLPGSGGLLGTAIALYFYYFIGSSLEREWGAGKFTIFYLSGVALNVVYGFLAWGLFPGGRVLAGSLLLDAFYLNLSMFFAFGALFPEQTILLFFIIPIKIKWLALLDAAIFLYSVVSALAAGAWFSAVLPVVAILNFFLICGAELVSYLRALRPRRRPSNVVNFRQAAREIKKRQEGADYRHKCAVCGRTDRDSPGLEFRYCSRCEGYHCFCEEHINNHVHFQ